MTRVKTLTLVFFLYSLLLLSGVNIARAQIVHITALVPGICSNSIIEVNEYCDGANLAGQSCISQGFASGALSCNPNCTFNTSQCVAPAPPAPLPSGRGGGGGGGGGYAGPPAYQTAAIFRGRAYPASDITLLKDAAVVATTKAGPNASFEITVSNLAAGTYSFGIWGEDSQGFRPITQTFNIAVTSGVTTVVSGIFLPPTIGLNKTQVKRGDVLNIFGQSAPGSQVSITINSDVEILKKTIADAAGAWLYQFDTSEVDYGDHSTRSRGALDNAITAFSQVAFFKVGNTNILAKEPKKCPTKGDLNGDCKVDLIDFSIAGYWFKRKLSSDFLNIEKMGLGDRGVVDLVDFSIMAYYWTG